MFLVKVAVQAFSSNTVEAGGGEKLCSLCIPACETKQALGSPEKCTEKCAISRVRFCWRRGFLFFPSRDFLGVGYVAVCLWGGCGGVISHVRYYVGGWVSSSSSPPTCMKGKRSEGED